MASRLGLEQHVPLGPVSLHFDDALEFGVFTHERSGGGSFLTPEHLQSDTSANDWQDRFEIDALEVWGCGGSEEAEEQRKAWQWEEREAEARRRINLGTGDIEADKELLRMAGIISGERSGGSMG
ncbi:Restriction of telomere capping protein 5 [Coniosporium uncinatum]|uniref:Restriction of telomere capping protein 5 n=1 Tax=Coniosporium uncinatum TaxID=93489 RepID=A0ACC3DR24_9PEZI|nr:Restriction of telomere capping protein 5 [Coniosporium uncinatum]